MLHQPVHSGDADRRDQRADRRRNQTDEQRDQHGNRDFRAGIVRKRLQRDDDEQEDQRQYRQQDVQRDLVRRLLALRALDERDHSIQERVPGIRRHAHLDPVRDDARAASDGRPVAARLADDRRRLAGDRRFVDRSHALDDLAVGGNELSGLHHDDVVLAQARRGHLLDLPAGGQPVRHGLRSRLAQCVRLRLAAALSHRFGEVGEQHREPEPEGDLACEEGAARASRSSWTKTIVVRRLPTSTMNITGFLIWIRGSSFQNESTIACRTMPGSQMEILRALADMYVS